jgi:hypothetical protein
MVPGPQHQDSHQLVALGQPFGWFNIGSSLAALYVQYRTLRDDTLWVCGVIGNATKSHFRQRYQTGKVLGGRPRLPCIILCMKVDARCSLTTVCPAQKQIKPLTFLWTSMSSTQSTDRKSSTGMDGN